MARARKKPVEIDADQWFSNGDHPDDYKNEIVDHFSEEKHVYSSEFQIDNNWEGQVVRFYRHPDVDGDSKCKHCYEKMYVHGWIDTLEGGHIVCPGDYIITGVEGERYPCKPGIFLKTYDLVEEDEDSIGPLTDYAHKIIDDLKNQNSLIDSRLFKDWGPLESTEIPTFKEIEDEDGRG